MADSNGPSADPIGPAFNDHAGNEPAPSIDDGPALPEPEAPNQTFDANQGISSSFNVETAQEQVQAQPSPTPASDVTATAQAEIALKEREERAYVWHDDKWRQITERLANRAQAAPSMDMDGGVNRSVTREYNQYRQEWTAQRDAIEANAATMKADIRAQGTTLTDEHTKAANEAAAEHSQQPDVDHAVQNEFAVKSVDPSRGR